MTSQEQMSRYSLDSQSDFIQVPRRQSSRYSLGPTSSLRPSLAHAQSMGNGFGYRDVSGTTQRSRAPSSNTWSTSDETFDLEDKEEREPFIHDYNKLATKCGISVIVPDSFEPIGLERVVIEGHRSNWLMRNILRRRSTITYREKRAKTLKHKKAIPSTIVKPQKSSDMFHGKTVDELIRLCGSSTFYLPAEYSPGTLKLPTCLRATAQYLVQHAGTQSIFRLPGSKKVVEDLYSHYSMYIEQALHDVQETIRPPTLPVHIDFEIHDIAGAFKKFLIGLPCGILGSTWLFDALLAIYIHFDNQPETLRTKKTKVRARLIALAIACVPSRWERELICAVMGLLCLIGRTAEIIEREDHLGRPLPPSNLMGYQSLSIIFGPMLLGLAFEGHTIRSTMYLGEKRLDTASYDPAKTTSRMGTFRRHGKHDQDDTERHLLRVERCRLVNSITEMLITNWRDVVRQMNNFGALAPTSKYHAMRIMQRTPSLFEEKRYRSDPPIRPIAIRPSRDFNVTPTPSSRTTPDILSERNLSKISSMNEPFPVHAHKTRKLSSQLYSSKSMNILSPTLEEAYTLSPQIKPQNDHIHEHLHSLNCSGNGSPKGSEIQGLRLPHATEPESIILQNELELPGTDIGDKSLYDATTTRKEYSVNRTESSTVAKDECDPNRDIKLIDPMSVELVKPIAVTNELVPDLQACEQSFCETRSGDPFVEPQNSVLSSMPISKIPSTSSISASQSTPKSKENNLSASTPYPTPDLTPDVPIELPQEPLPEWGKPKLSMGHEASSSEYSARTRLSRSSSIPHIDPLVMPQSPERSRTYEPTVSYNILEGFPNAQVIPTADSVPNEAPDLPLIEHSGETQPRNTSKPAYIDTSTRLKIPELSKPQRALIINDLPNVNPKRSLGIPQSLHIERSRSAPYEAPMFKFEQPLLLNNSAMSRSSVYHELHESFLESSFKSSQMLKLNTSPDPSRCKQFARNRLPESHKLSVQYKLCEIVPSRTSSPLARSDTAPLKYPVILGESPKSKETSLGGTKTVSKFLAASRTKSVRTLAEGFERMSKG